MKKGMLILFAVTSAAGVFAQVNPNPDRNNLIEGFVKNGQGAAVPYASIVISGHHNGVQADSLGNFRIHGQNGDTIIVSAIGYRDTTIKINSSTPIAVYLRKNENSLAEVRIKTSEGLSASNEPTITDQQVLSSSLNDYKTSNNLSYGVSFNSQLGTKSALDNTHTVYDGLSSGRLYTGSLLPVFSAREDTKGSRYLFGDWVKGSITTAGNETIENNSYLFNYDKVSDNLLITQDKKMVIEVAKKEMKSFELAQNEQTYKFVKIPMISDRNFLQVLVQSDKYSLYKLFTTKFEKANYISDGLTESGHNYDEYIDMPAYFIVFPSKVFRTIELKRKSIKTIFYSEEKKVKKFFSTHNDEFVNEGFLTGLVNFLNQ